MKLILLLLATLAITAVACTTDEPEEDFEPTVTNNDPSVDVVDTNDTVIVDENPVNDDNRGIY